ncbi:hypothetical protein [Desulfosporosinus sp. Sb-LF]|uniref:hypothetical protein n=1 Tax=Desulfosporosinus sp. Sb-LF TaxID=2560027 RepID=UPI00107F77C1|nr:hypothetical protein [Desulfosporosinus sp. Sb-LF]TGE32091.1 hypothetical protein E4K68_13280 [Desulfosporosinus sp. Sb-LF]
MGRKIRSTILVSICILVLTGCTNQGQVKENAQLKTKIELLKQQNEAANNKVKEHEELYELRNTLDSNLNITLRSLTKGDYESAQKNLAPTIHIKDKKMITSSNAGDYEFIIPDKPMNLRQRAFMKNGGNYSAIYEMYDAGYTTGYKYVDRIYTLNVGYVQDGGTWKLSSVMIDE